jgi:hypothetical protein
MEFWGFKHIIEEVPYRVQEAKIKNEIEVLEFSLPIGMNISQDCIPRELSDPQLVAVHALGEKVAAHERNNEDQVLDAFCGHDGPYAIEYFFCHAGVESGAGIDFDKSYLGFSRPDGGLTLETIKLNTSSLQFKNHPLFILNACESGKMDGRFYDGFVPKLMNMGACGVVGSDNKVPALFGAHFGLMLLQVFLGGKAIGAAVRSVRCQLLEAYHNPLGLIYRVFGDADVHLSRPLISHL